MTGIKETKKNWIVDVDIYTQRDRYYQGDTAGVVYLIDKSEYPSLFDRWNMLFDTQLDMLLALDNTADCNGIKHYRRGYIIQ